MKKLYEPPEWELMEISVRGILMASSLPFVDDEIDDEEDIH